MCASCNCVIARVTSNETIDGQGDGHTSVDWHVTGPLSVELRAERTGQGAGRIYTLDVDCVDGSGNRSTHAVTVAVPR